MRNKFANSVRKELARARILHKPMTSSHEAYAQIWEELDEFWDEVRSRVRSRANMGRELVQCAAMCQRAAEDLGLEIENAHNRRNE